MQAILHEVTGKNRYCGPTAISTVLGISTDDAAALARAYNGSNAIRGLATNHLAAVLRNAGCRVLWHRVEGKPTLAAWLKATTLPADKHVIVVFRNHFGTLLGRHYLCSQTNCQRVRHADIPGRRGRVEEYLIVDSLPAVAPVVPRPVRTAQSTVERRAREESNRLARLHDIEIEKRDGGSFFVWPPSGLEDEADPYEGDHNADDWSEVLEMVLAYVKLIEAVAA